MARDNPPAEGRRGWFGFETVTSVMNSIGTGWVFALLFIINTDIWGRLLFNHPIRGVPEIVALSIVACVFLGLAHTLKVGRLTRTEVFLDFLFQKAPRLGHLLQGLFHMVGAGLFAVLFRASFPLFTKAWRIDEYVGASGDFMAPVWPVKLIILIGCIATCLQFLLLAYRDIMLVINPGLREQESGGVP